jgi:UDP-N-acetylmuramoyl-L-alanyl-D-glutamate--2,6-diaminopimelate ligase
MDSREADDFSGGLFFCIVGASFDGHTAAAHVVKRGAAALIVERFMPQLDVPQVKVSSMRVAISKIAQTFYDYPANGMTMIGITGTKGKTTTTYLLKGILDTAGLNAGLIGTTGALYTAETITRDGSAQKADKMIPSSLTTPDPIELQKILRQMADAGVRAVSMEISAHAIDMNRFDGMQFKAGAFTNISQDHLDYFHTMENYWQTKRKLFTEGFVRAAAFNADDEVAQGMMEGVAIPKVTFGIREDNSDILARDIDTNENGVSYTLCVNAASLHGMNDSVRNGSDSVRINLRIPSTFNIYNSLAAVSVALLLGIDLETIARGLASVRSVPGRIEPLDTHTPYKVVLDYSHSPAALESILEEVRRFTKKRLICLFGCGGDRDPYKRPIMGEISGRLADFSILTSDNPRTEDPFAILAEIEEGIKPTGKAYTVIENRRDAIRYALNFAKEGDIVVLAGKGHETYQEINGKKYPFDEKVVVQELLSN